jgi:hypothetical protein
VLVGEKPVDVDAIAKSVKAGFDKGKTSTIIVLAEARNDLKDELIKKVADATGRTVNHVSLSYMQRGGYPAMADRVLASRFAVRAVEEGFCSIALEQRYMGANGQTDSGDPACIKKNACMPSILIGRTAIGERVWDVHRLIDIIQKYLTEYIDKDQIICMGNSGGGTTTFYASCYDERIPPYPACV